MSGICTSLCVQAASDSKKLHRDAQRASKIATRADLEVGLGLKTGIFVRIQALSVLARFLRSRLYGLFPVINRLLLVHVPFAQKKIVAAVTLLDGALCIARGGSV